MSGTFYIGWIPSCNIHLQCPECFPRKSCCPCMVDVQLTIFGEHSFTSSISHFEFFQRISKVIPETELYEGRDANPNECHSTLTSAIRGIYYIYNSEFRPFWEVRKKFKLLKHKKIIYYFEARDLEIPNIYIFFRKIFKFREDKSKNVFREIHKCFRKTAKFEFFAKQIIYLESPDHPFQNNIYVCVLRV